MKRAATTGWPRRLMLALGLWTAAASSHAQTTGSGAPPLPGPRELAAALAEPTSRPDALLTLLAVSRLLERNAPGDADAVPALVDGFRDDRAWLDRLAARYAELPSRSTVLDPAAWFVQQELGQHRIHPAHDVSPLGPDFEALTGQLFDRSAERLAAAFLPESLFAVEARAMTIWRAFRERAEANTWFAQVAGALLGDWFDPWNAAEPPAPERGLQGVEPRDAAFERLRRMMYALTLPGPPDALLVRRLRFNLNSALAAMEPADARAAERMLHLASGVDGLQQGRYLAFTQNLLWAVTELLDSYLHDDTSGTPLAGLIAGFLPRLSATLSPEFNDIDPRLNANIAAAFDVAQELADGQLPEDRAARLQEELADAVAQQVLLAPDLAFYFDQPVRRRISEEIDICISVAVTRDESGGQTLTRQQFDGCLASMVGMVDTQLRSAELAGEPSGPYGVDQLRRELDLMPWQRVNYLLGYLHELAPTTCPEPVRPLPNPLDWSVLASLLTWFTAEAPVFLHTPENESRVTRMAQHGEDLMRAMSRQVDCISGSGSGVKDPVREAVSQYRAALDELVRGIRNAELAFRTTRLKPGADVVLGGAVNQRTAYRTPGLMIGPCDQRRSCEMTQPLEATRALIGLFPDQYLIADQTGLGSVEICYDDMQWVDRRSEPVRPDERDVSNYYGHLSFKLLGRYHEGGRVRNVFGSQFVSPDEYHYLIAATDPAVLADGCPTEWVGTRIVTAHGDDDGFRLVPNRLTYLAAARSKPSDVILANWNRGAEWRDWFVTGLGVTPLQFDPDPGLRDRLAAHLRALYQAEQQAVYGALLRPGARSASAADIALHDLLVEVTTYKTLLRSLLALLYPETLLDSDEIRAMVEGQNGLLDEAAVRHFRSNSVPAGQVHDVGIARLQRFQGLWSRQPEPVVRSGSVATSVAHAMARLEALSRAHFSVPAPGEPAEGVQPVPLPDVTPPPAASEHAVP